MKWTEKFIQRRIVGGSESTRTLFWNLRRLTMWKDYQNRAAMALECRLKAKNSIPKEAGFKVFAPGFFPETLDIVNYCKEYIRSLEQEDVQHSRKSQLKTGLLDMTALKLDSPILRFALRTDILEMVSAYLGVVPVLSKVDVWYSQFVRDENENSQLFHCDWADLTQMKVFVLVTDVKPENGPLTLLEAESSQLLRNRVNYRFVGPRYRVLDEEVETLLGNPQQHAMTGSAGTVAFVDTGRCFHFGSRLSREASPRIVLMLQYLTPPSFALPLHFQEGAPLRHLSTPQLSPLQRLILGKT